jgi:hypothetical protein
VGTEDGKGEMEERGKSVGRGLICITKEVGF